MTTVQPQARPGASFHIPIINGKSGGLIFTSFGVRAADPSPTRSPPVVKSANAKIAIGASSGLFVGTYVGSS